ncbi:MAG: hypothetical protein K8S56_00075, partial [Candidatus Cloacimonetes bacterium]|nr:hypothetical protein [Candidatus Cloacimonadota bacterium]
MFTISFSPVLIPNAILTTQDGIIIVTTGYLELIEEDLGQYWGWSFTYVFKTDFNGNILWTSCDDSIDGMFFDTTVQIIGQTTYSSGLLNDGFLITRQYDGIFIRNGETGEISSYLNFAVNEHFGKEMILFAEENQICLIRYDSSENKYLSFYNTNDLTLNHEILLDFGFTEEQRVAINLLKCNDGVFYFSCFVDYERFIYILDTNDNISHFLDGYIYKMKFDDDGSAFAVVIDNSTSSPYSIVHYSVEGDILDTFEIDENNYFTPSSTINLSLQNDDNKVYINEFRLDEPQIYYLSRITAFSITDFTKQSHYQFEESGSIAYCRKANGFYATTVLSRGGSTADYRDMTLFCIDDSEMQFADNEIPFATNLLNCFPNPFNPTTTISFSVKP